MIFINNNRKTCGIIRWGFFFMVGSVDYKKLWKLMIDKDIKKKTDLIPLAGISTNVLAKLNKGDYISMESMHKLCIALECDVGDICVMNPPKSDQASSLEMP